MNIDCQWIEKNMEAFFGDGLDDLENQLARAHVEGCDRCRREVAALIAIDPVVKNYFRQQMSIARTPRRVRRSLIYGTAAAVLAAVFLFAVMLRGPQVNTTSPSPLSQAQTAANTSAEAPLVIKEEAGGETLRAKPDELPATAGISASPARADDRNAPDFLVTDAAGYTRSLNDFRGYVALIGIWSSGHPEALANLESLYKNFSSNTRLRFVGVTSESGAKAANTTFPVFYNQGSKLFGARPGDFVLLDETGSVRLRGSLTTDFDTLLKSLQ